MQKNILAAIIFSVSFFAFFVLILPQYDAIKSIREAFNSRQAILNEKTVEFNRVKELDSQVKARQSDINKIKSFLPERKQIDELVSSIQNISERSGMQMGSMTISDVPTFEETRYKKISIGIDLLGPYPSFVNLLKLLEQSLRLYDVYEITAASSTTFIGSVGFAIKINTYYLK